MAYIHPLISATTTDSWLTFWNVTFKAALEAAIGEGGGGWPSEFTQNGRLINDDSDAGAAQLTGSPALAIVIPDGAQYVVAGVLHTADGDQTIVGLTPNAINWLEVTIDGEGAWDVIEHATRPAAGSGVLGKVTTGASSVTDLDTSESESDVILTMPLLVARQRNILERLDALENGGGTGGGAAYTGLGPWLPLPGDSRQTAVVIDDLLETLRADLEAAIQEGGVRREDRELRHLIQEQAAQGIGLTEVNPAFNNRSTNTTIVLGTWGNGEAGGPDDLIEGTSIINSELKTIGPL